MKNLRSAPPELPAEVMICSTEAFIDRDSYTIPLPPRSINKEEQDLLFRQWQADIIIKYPELLKSYDLLYGCWSHYFTTK